MRLMTSESSSLAPKYLASKRLGYRLNLTFFGKLPLPNLDTRARRRRRQHDKTAGHGHRSIPTSMFASLGFLAERFQSPPIRIDIDTISDKIHGRVYDKGPVEVTLRGVLRLHKSVKTIVNISQDTATFDFSIKGLPNSLSLPDVELSYTITASGAFAECTKPIWIQAPSTAVPRTVSQQLTCKLPGMRGSPCCSRQALALQVDASCGALVLRDEGALAKLAIAIACDDGSHPGTIHADVEWTLQSVTTVDDHVIQSTIAGQRRQVRWSRWAKKTSWMSEASIWVTVPRKVTPTFKEAKISHAYVLSVQLRLSTLAEHPKLLRIFNIEPEALVYELPIVVAYPSESCTRDGGSGDDLM